MKTIKSITWKGAGRCMRKGCPAQATHRVELRDDADNPYFSLNLCLCPECSALPEQDLIHAFLGRRGER